MAGSRGAEYCRADGVSCKSGEYAVQTYTGRPRVILSLPPGAPRLHRIVSIFALVTKRCREFCRRLSSPSQRETMRRMKPREVNQPASLQKAKDEYDAVAVDKFEKCN